MISQFTSALAKENINIPDMTNKSRGQYAYTLLDTDTPITPEIAKKIEEMRVF
jgi:D-3-phosphoglycerate dehydrogenase